MKASDCKEEGTDKNLTLLDTGKKIDLNSEFVGVDQLEREETYRMEQSNETLENTDQKDVLGGYELLTGNT